MDSPELLSLLSSLVTESKIDEYLFRDTSPARWKEIFELSCPHGTAPVTCDLIGTLPPEMHPPKRVMIPWILQTEKAENSYLKKCSIISYLSDLLSSHNLEFVLLKGASTASYYPRPEHRYFGDIDFYVLDNETGALASERADSVISSAISVDTDKSHHHHNVYVYNGVLLEHHYDFIEVHSHPSSIPLEARLKELSLSPRGTVVLPSGDSSFEVKKAPADFNALFLLRHMASHFAAAEIGLRHLLDYALFLKHENADIDYKALRKELDEFHLLKFASALNYIMTKYLNLPKEYTTGDLSDQPLADKILNEIIHPAFPIYNAQKNGRTPLSSISFRTRRFFANRWKHDLIYPENFYATFLHSSYSHLLKPKSLLK